MVVYFLFIFESLERLDWFLGGFVFKVFKVVVLMIISVLGMIRFLRWERWIGWFKLV